MNTVATPRVEAFHWTAILFSQTLGHGARRLDGRHQRTSASEAPPSCSGPRLPCSSQRRISSPACSRVFLFWAAFILTRPLGATLGDLFDKPITQEGFGFNRFEASAILAAAIIALILIPSQVRTLIPGSPSETPAE